MKKNKGQFSFFDLENQLDKIYELNDFLPKLKALVDFEIFRYQLNKVRDKPRLSNAGRPPFDVVLMFKVFVLKSMYNLSDEKIEEQIRDRISFRDFLDLSFADTVPDAKTILAPIFNTVLFNTVLRNSRISGSNASCSSASARNSTSVASRRRAA